MQAAPSSAKPLYFVNAPVDFFFVGGASIVTFACILLFQATERTAAMTLAAMYLMWVINWPHFSMSTYRLYQSRANIDQYPFTAWVVPFIVIGGVALSLSYPDTVAPYFVKLFLIWSPYHFSGQTVGITLIYARRAGMRIEKPERTILSAFVFGTFFLSSIRAEAGREGQTYYGVAYPAIGVPQWAITASEWGMWILIGLFAAMAVYWCMKQRRMVPPIVLLPAVTQYVWFVQSVYTPSFQEFVPMFHSLQYILIAWGIQLKERQELRGIEPSRKYVVAETARWSALNLAGGVALFYFLPEFGAWLGYPPAVAAGVIIAAVQIHHFFVDGVIWKLKNQTVSHPLMMNVRDLIRPPAPQPQPQPQPSG